MLVSFLLFVYELLVKELLFSSKKSVAVDIWISLQGFWNPEVQAAAKIQPGLQLTIKHILRMKTETL